MRSVVEVLTGVPSDDVNGCASCRILGSSTGDLTSVADVVATTLAHGTGTVTELLEHLAGEPIDADIIHQRGGPAGVDNPLGLPVAARTMHRAVLLAGRATGRVFVYAESVIATDRLPPEACQRLEMSRDPIGRVLVDHHLDVNRQWLGTTPAVEHPDQRVAALIGAAVQSRRYCITIDHHPAMIVSEWFLRSVSDAFAEHLRTPDP
jgi:chorismate--pyruvate lyase